MQQISSQYDFYVINRPSICRPCVISSTFPCQISDMLYLRLFRLTFFHSPSAFCQLYDIPRQLSMLSALLSDTPHACYLSCGIPLLQPPAAKMENKICIGETPSFLQEGKSRDMQHLQKCWLPPGTKNNSIIISFVQQHKKVLYVIVFQYALIYVAATFCALFLFSNEHPFQLFVIIFTLFEIEE